MNEERARERERGRERESSLLLLSPRKESKEREKYPDLEKKLKRF